MAQQQDDFWQDVRFGGSAGLNFGNNGVQIGIAPSAIKPVNDVLSFGAGLNFTYAKFDESRLTAVGGSLISLINPVPPVQISMEYEQLRVTREIAFIDYNLNESYWLPALYAGVGYQAGPVIVGVRYDLLYNEDKSLFSQPWLPFVRFFF